MRNPVLGLTIILGLVTMAEAVEDWAGLTAAPGREEVFTICSGCHSLKLVTQQRLDRPSWEETLIWMVEEQGMAELDEETNALVLDYLESQYGRTVPR